jgi:cation-transporting ATPase E
MSEERTLAHLHELPGPRAPHAGAVAPTLLASGLSEREALARRSAGQGNSAPIRTTRTYAQIVRENLLTLINIALFAVGLALILLGRVSDALISVVVVLVNILVSMVQEVRAKRTLDRIALLTRPKASVIRDGRERAIDPNEIVVGDLLVVRPGDQIVVDGPAQEGSQLDVDESLLSGESEPVPKHAGDTLFSGSFCVAGSGVYRAEHVGAASAASQLTAGARAFRRVLTPLQSEINLVVRIILLLAVFFELLLGARSAIDQVPLVESVRMADVILKIVPIGLFLAISTAYALGAVRIAGQGALVQQANAVESLSHVDVLCLDKTGTLTTNQLTFDALHPLALDAASLRSQLGDFVASVRTPNATSSAIARACPGAARHVRDEIPFASVRKWSALALDDPARRSVYVLGAPEILAPALRPGSDVGAEVERLAAAGLRVVLFAGRDGLVALRDAEGEPCLPSDLTPLGLITLSDQLRPEAQATLRAFAGAGIQVKIISGDHPRAVAALARQAGVAGAERVVSGVELAAMSPEELAEVAEQTTIFGRITPQQKEQIVRALRDRGHYVAMIGDGVNDVLSLKQAHLAVAVQSGSQAARSVADIVLLTDSFAVLPPAFREGQRIRNGMQAILKLFMTRVGYFALLLVATGIVGGFPFTPKHSSILVFVTVGVPTLALAAWARPGQMGQRDLVAHLLRFVVPAALLLAMSALAVYLWYYVPVYHAYLRGSPHMSETAAMQAALPTAQSALTTFSVLCGLLLIPFAQPPTPAWTGGSQLSGDWRPTLLALGLLVGYVGVLAVPLAREFFELAPLAPWDYALLAAASALWALALRAVWRHHLLERFLHVSFDAPGPSY